MAGSGGDDARILTLLYEIRDFFRTNSNNDLVGVKISKEDINRALGSNNR